MAELDVEVGDTRNWRPLTPVEKTLASDPLFFEFTGGCEKAKEPEYLPLPLELESASAAERSEELFALLSRERETLEKSIEAIVEVMRTQSGEELEKKMGAWVEERTSRLLEIRNELSFVQKSQRLLSGVTSRASDITGQFSRAGLPSIAEVDAYAIKSLCGVDYSTGLYYGDETASDPSGTPPTAPLWESKLCDMTGSYRNKLKILGGVKTFGATATWIAKQCIIGRGERSLIVMKENLRRLEAGESGDLYLWLEGLSKACKSGPAAVEKALVDQGVDVASLFGEGDLHELLQSHEGKEKITLEVIETLKSEVEELETFITLERESLEEEAVSLSLSLSKFGSDLSIIILSSLGRGTLIPDVLSSIFLFGINVRQFSSAVKADCRADSYLDALRRGVAAVDKTVEKGFEEKREGKGEDEVDHARKFAEGRYEAMVNTLFPGKKGNYDYKELVAAVKNFGFELRAALETIEEEAASKGGYELLTSKEVREALIDRATERIRSEMSGGAKSLMEHLAKMKKIESEQIGKVEGKYDHLFSEMVGEAEGKSIEGGWPLLQRECRENFGAALKLPVETKWKGEEFSRFMSVERESIISALKATVVAKVEPELDELLDKVKRKAAGKNCTEGIEILRSGFLEKFGYMPEFSVDERLQEGSFALAATNLRSTLLKELQQKKAAEVNERFAFIERRLLGISHGKELDAAIALFRDRCKELFGISLEIDSLQSAGSDTIADFLRKNRGAIVSQIARQHEALNVTTRNALRTIATKKGEGDQTLTRWEVATSALDLSGSSVGIVSSILLIISVIGAASFAVAFAYMNFAILGVILLSFAVGMGLLYYYKPNLFRSIFSMNGVKATFAQLKIARRCFDQIEARHQKNLLAVELLTEKVDLQLGGVELARRIYEKSAPESDEKKFAENQLKNMGLITEEGLFDNEKWLDKREALMKAKHAVIREKVAHLKIGHTLDLGSFGIGSQEVDVGSWLDSALEKVKESCSGSSGAAEVRESLLNVIFHKFEKKGLTLTERERQEFRQIAKEIDSLSDIDSAEFRTNLLIAYATTYLHKEIERQKEESSLFFDSYNTTAKFVEEYSRRLQTAAFDDAMNRIAFGSAHAKRERLARAKYEKVMKSVEELVEKRGEETSIDKDRIEELMQCGLNIDWLKRDLALYKMEGIKEIGALLKDDIRQLILLQCRDGVGIEEKREKVLALFDEILAIDKEGRGTALQGAKKHPIDEEMKRKLYGRGIDIYRAIDYAKEYGYNAATLEDLYGKELLDEIARRFRGDWFQLFRECPKNIAEMIKGGELDPETRKFLSEEMGIDLEKAAKEIDYNGLRRFVALDGAPLAAFHEKRELMAKRQGDSSL